MTRSTLARLPATCCRFVTGRSSAPGATQNLPDGPGPIWICSQPKLCYESGHRMERAGDTTDAPVSDTGQHGHFAVTHWSIVLDAGADDLTRATAALERLCRTYWFPIYAFI